MIGRFRDCVSSTPGARRLGGFSRGATSPSGRGDRLVHLRRPTLGNRLPGAAQRGVPPPEVDMAKRQRARSTTRPPVWPLRTRGWLSPAERTSSSFSIHPRRRKSSRKTCSAPAGSGDRTSTQHPRTYLAPSPQTRQTLMMLVACGLGDSVVSASAVRSRKQGGAAAGRGHPCPAIRSQCCETELGFRDRHIGTGRQCSMHRPWRIRVTQDSHWPQMASDCVTPARPHQSSLSGVIGSARTRLPVA